LAPVNRTGAVLLALPPLALSSSSSLSDSTMMAEMDSGSGDDLR
jgi:hypothetical protein